MIGLNRKSFAILRKLYPFFIALITCIIGYTTIYFYIYTKDRALTINTNHLIISKIDTLYTSLRTTAIAISSLKNLDCQTIKPTLEKIAVKLPAIEMITLFAKNKPFCSSSNQPVESNLPPTDSPQILLQSQLSDTFLIFWNDKLYLKKANYFDNNISVLIEVKGNRVLQNILTPTRPLQVIVFSLYHHIITSDGVNEQRINLYRAIKEKSFLNYNFYIKTGYTAPLNLSFIFQYHTLLLLFVILLSICAYIVTQWVIHNISSAYYELSEAIDNDQIKAYAQPVYAAETGEIAGIEILARWIHPKYGLISPETFIRAAEENGLIIPMTQKLINQVAKALAPYANSIPINFHIGFNISRTHCETLQLVDDCKQFYKQVNTKNITLVIEITERELIEVTATTKKLFQELHKLNAKIALDDFGVGNSNLSYLNDFAIDYLKIDKSFISHIGSDSLSKSILDSIIDITHTCNIESCAEGVETEEQALYLQSKGVTFLQGYFFAHPAPIQEFIKHQLIQKRPPPDYIQRYKQRV